MEKQEYNKKTRKVLSSGETHKFIDVWRNKICDLRGQRKNSHIFKEMVYDLVTSYGIKLTAEEVRTRVNNLTKRYRKEKLNMGVTGGSPSEWEFYEVINEFIGNFKSNRANELLTESIDFIDTQDSLETGDLEIICYSPDPEEELRPTTSSASKRNVPQVNPLSKAKRKRDEVNEDILKIAIEEKNIFKQFVDQSQKNEEKRNELLQQNIDLQREILNNFLNKK